jgi:hypothetical protein
MKVTVTHLKAPWPAGAGVGSVVEFTTGAVPGCFVGKCTPAADDAQAGFVYPAPAAEVAAEPAEADPAAKALAAADEQHAAELAASTKRKGKA